MLFAVPKGTLIVDSSDTSVSLAFLKMSIYTIQFTVPKDRVALLTFYDFSAEHWVHIRTTNPREVAKPDGLAMDR